MKRLLISVSVAAASALAATAASPSADFNSIVGRVLASNPALAADSLTARADLLAMAAEGNLPDPEIGFDHKWGTTSEAGTRWGVEVSQSFDWPGTYRARRQAVGAAERAEELAARGRVRAVATEARLKLTDIVEANLRVATLEKVAANMDSLVELTRTRFDRGDVTVLTMKKVEFERFGAISSLEEARAEQDRLRADLAAMAGGQLIDTDGLTAWPEATLLAEADYLKPALPEIDALAMQVRAGELAAKAERLKRLPGFSVGYLHEYEEGMHFNGFSVGLTLPFFSTRHTAAAATARAESVEKTLEAARLDRAARVRADHAEASRLQKRIAEYHRIFGSDDYLMLLQHSFSQGQLTAHEYLGEINEYLALYLEHLSAEKAYRQAICRLSANL